MSLILTSARVARYASQTLLRNAFAAALYSTAVVKTGGSGSISSPAGVAMKNPVVEGGVLPVVASSPAASEVAAAAETSLTPKPKRARPAKNAAAGAEAKPKKEKPAKNTATAEATPKKEEVEKNAAAAEAKPKKEKPAKNAAAAVVGKPKKEKLAKNAVAAANAKPKKEKPAKNATAAANAKPKKEKPTKNAATAAVAKPKKEKLAKNAAAAVVGKPKKEKLAKNAVAAVAKPKRGRPAKNAVAAAKAKPKKEKPAKKSKLVAAKGVRKAALKKKVKKVAKKAAKPKEMRHSAYNLFLKEVFPTIQAASVGEKMKIASAKWKELSVDAKMAYARRSQSDEGLKKRRLTGMALFVKENYATVQSFPKLVEQWKALGSEEKAKYNERAAKGEGAKVLKAKSKAKAAKAPRALSGYVSYIKQVYPTLTGTATERIKLAASQWKNLSPEAKSAYQSPKAPAAAKRAPNCGYQLFLQEKTKGVTPVVTIVTAATQWRAMSDAQKQEYNVKAKRV